MATKQWSQWMRVKSMPALLGNLAGNLAISASLQQD